MQYITVNLYFPSSICLCGNKSIVQASLIYYIFIGIYRLVPHTMKHGFLAPVYKKEGNPVQYLYSHHHEGRLWLLGQSYTSWSIRLDMVTPFKVSSIGIKKFENSLKYVWHSLFFIE